MRFATWRPVTCNPGISASFAAHLHGRDLIAEEPTLLACDPASMDRIGHPDSTDRWRWRVVSPTGHVLATGLAPDLSTAEAAAEDEVEAVHPPTRELIETLLS